MLGEDDSVGAAGVEVGEMGSVGLGSDGDRLCAGFEGGDGLSFRDAKGLFPCDIWADGALGELACGPVKVDLQAAACAQALHCAFRPGRRKCGQKVDSAGMALQEKLGDSGGGAE